MASPFPFSLEHVRVQYFIASEVMAAFNADFIETVQAYGAVSNTGRRRSARAFEVDPSSYRFYAEAIVSSRDRNRSFLYYEWDVIHLPSLEFSLTIRTRLELLTAHQGKND